MKSNLEIERSEKYGYNLHVADFIYKKMNETVAINGTESVIETLEKVRPMSGNGSNLSDWSTSSFFPSDWMSASSSFVSISLKVKHFEIEEPL